jgi:gentisate 1,2-dioxygenase
MIFFCIPSWVWHEHKNTSKSDEAFLYSFNDFPVMESLGLYQEEPLNENKGHQKLAS